MTVARMVLFSMVGGLAASVGGVAARAGRQPVDWTSLSLDAIGGGKLPTAGYRGKVVLLVNTASRCGFTGQYRGLEASWRRHRDRGLILLGVPSNDFGGQEPDGDDAIARFCETRFDITFPLAGKQVVSGPNAHPLYRWAAGQTGPSGAPNWNFHKLLISRDGRLVDWFSAMTKPGAASLETAIGRALDEPASS